MSSMESFYGGRQGASFVIVKKFDGLSIPERSVCRVGWYAKDEDDYFYVNSDGSLIERNANNYGYFYKAVTPAGTENPSEEGWYELTSNGYILTSDITVISGKTYYVRRGYAKWGTVPKDGVTIVTSQSGQTSNPLPLEYAEGMEQCFRKGGATTSEVGYGEYVIIDTMFGLGEGDNPDNGKVYRRGMNYDQSLGGAEYIGQIVGPKGSSPELEMTTIADILEHTESQERHYIPTMGDAQDGIVPGRYFDDQQEEQYNDNITYGWATVRDNHNNITGALIGFTFPYLVPEIFSHKRKPYYTQEDYDLGRIDDPDLIGTAIHEIDNFELFVDNDEISPDRDPTHGDTGHPFYRKWKVTIPQGIKGDTQTQLEIVPQKVRVNADLWDTDDVTQEPATTADDDTYVILDDARFEHDCVYPYDDASALVAVEKESEPGVTYYAKIEDTYMLKFRYRQTNYDEHENGSDYQIIDLGDYNTIRKIWLTDEGYLWVRYNADEDGIINSTTPVSWIESMALANKDNPSSFDPESTDVNSGHFRIIYNNNGTENKTGTWTDDDGIVHAIWETDITWPQSVSLNAEGLLKFLYNNNLYYDQTIYTDPNEGSYQFSIPWITNVLISQNGTFTVSYNNEVNAGTYPPAEWDDTTHTWTKVLNFIDHVTIDDDGKIHFWYSNGREASNTGYVNIRIKYLKDAQVDTGLNTESEFDFDGEGSGDQKIHLTWNTETTGGIKDTSIIGAPLNYIMEALVSTYDPKAPTTPQNHLLVLYSDPAYRQWLKDNYPEKVFTYTSQKYKEESSSNPYIMVTPEGTENPSEEGWYEVISGDYVLTSDTVVIPSKTYYIRQIVYMTRDDWFDLGYVKGEPGGLHIIGEYVLSYKTVTPIGTEDPSAEGWYEFDGTNYTLTADTVVDPNKTYYEKETYKDYLVDGVPPESMPGNTPEERGWAYLIVSEVLGVSVRTIYTYDYVHDVWVIVAEINDAVIDPTRVVILDKAKIDSSTGAVIPDNIAYIDSPKSTGLWFIESEIKAAY